MIKITRIVGISGTRNSHGVIGYSRVDIVRGFVRSLPQDHSCMVVAGGASGVDTVAIDCAKDRGLAYAVIPYYRDMARRGGLARNITLVDFIDELWCFWDLISPGTRHAALTAKKMNKLKEVFGPTGESIEVRF